MAVTELNHFNICAPRPLLDQVRDFYVDVIGLAEGWRPDVEIPGYWLYAGDRPLVHLMVAVAGPVQLGAGHLDHVAFSCTDVEATAARLHRLGQNFKRRDSAAFGFSQLVLTDPTGLGVELNFKL